MAAATVSRLFVVGLLAVLVPALVLSMQLMGETHEYEGLFQAMFAYGVAGLIGGAAAALLGLGWRGWLLFAVAVLAAALVVAFVRDSSGFFTVTVLATVSVLIPATLIYGVVSVTRPFWGRQRSA